MIYSLEIRKAVMAALDAGLTGVEVERIFGVCLMTQNRWAHRLKRYGSLKQGRFSGWPWVL
jgi:transposase